MSRMSSLTTSCLAAPVAIALAAFVGAPTQAKACELPENRPHQSFAAPSATYDTDGFIHMVEQMMSDYFMGYVVAIQDRNGDLVAAVNHGWARTPCAPEGALGFSNNTYAPWGSVTKAITATAVMRKNEIVNGRNVDHRMIDYLPPEWRSEVSPAYEGLTIGNLIQHRGGFDKKAPRVDGEPLTVRQRLAQVEPERPVAAGRKYANINYTLFDYMPTFLNPNAEIAPPPAGLSVEEYDAYYRAEGAKVHIRHLRKRLFDPIGVNLSCNDPTHTGDNYARNYGGRNDTKEGYLVNTTDEIGCAVGGIVLSPAGMLKFLHAVSLTDTLVSRDTWALMARDSVERYGWPQRPDVRQDPSVGGEYNGGLAYGHSG
ncbi:MAG: serine hydrolase domain-containing protein, partial [Pseudomonadota bacterium]